MSGIVLDQFTNLPFLKLVKSVEISPDTRHFYFALPSADHKSGLITASCLLAKYVTEKGNNVVRPYTPISDVEQKGQLEFAIKRYPTGKFGNHLFSLKENDTVSFKGPIVKWEWTPNQFENVTLIGGGSGITPLYQLLHEITKNPEEKTKINLVYGNKTPGDILLKKILIQSLRNILIESKFIISLIKLKVTGKVKLDSLLKIG